MSSQNGWKIVSGESHSCLIFPLQEVRCFGNNTFNQLGMGVNDGSILARDSLPILITGQGDSINDDVKPIKVSAGSKHTCILYSDQGLRCFGDNSVGQLGLKNSQVFPGRPSVPVAFPDLGEATSFFSTPRNGLCATSTTGKSFCIGEPFYRNDNSKYKFEVMEDISKFLEKNFNAGFASNSIVQFVESSLTTSCILLSGNQIYCTGATLDHIPIDEIQENIYKVINTENWLSHFENPSLHACSNPDFAYSLLEVDPELSQKIDRKIYSFQVGNKFVAFGCGIFQEVASLLPLDSNQFAVDRLITFETGFDKFCVGLNFFCNVESSGNLFCRGTKDLRTGADLIFVQEFKFPSYRNVESISCGSDFVCAIDSKRSVWCAGDNSRGQLGINSSTVFVDFQNPVEVTTLPFRQIPKNFRVPEFLPIPTDDITPDPPGQEDSSNTNQAKVNNFPEIVAPISVFILLGFLVMLFLQRKNIRTPSS